MNAHRAKESEVWGAYHRRRFRFFAAWLGSPVALTLLMLLRNAFPAAGILILVVIPVVVPAIVVQNYRLSHWRCPRYAHYFFWSRGLFNPGTAQCMHCGLFAGDDPNAR